MRAGKALTDHFDIFVDEDCHFGEAPCQLDALNDARKYCLPLFTNVGVKFITELPREFVRVANVFGSTSIFAFPSVPCVLPTASSRPSSSGFSFDEKTMEQTLPDELRVSLKDTSRLPS